MKYPFSLSLVDLFKYALLTSLLVGCASAGINYFELDHLFGKASPPDRMVNRSSDHGQNYLHSVKPLIDKRCVVCHGCYDAPCQLKLTSPDGIERGANKELVYNGTRILNSNPTRLGIDATSVEQWREKEFFNVLNERNQTPNINLKRSLVYKLLDLKQNHPLPTDKLLDDDFSLGLDREQQCATIDEFPEFADDNPLWGMPYGLPALSVKEHETLVSWLQSGSPMTKPAPLPADIQTQIQSWEELLNGDSLKQQLTSRYIYEHLFLGHIYFDPQPLFTAKQRDIAPTHYFTLVRSSTPPSQPINVIATRRPYDDPGVDRVYYRLKRFDETVVSKSHMPYAFNQQRLDWVKSLFITPEYSVNKLPGYGNKFSENPLLAFQDLPMASRYRFMLEEAEFTIMGFIKGPVCRGQIALNVIDDHFWVTFIDPEKQSSPSYNKFLAEHKNNLRLPGNTNADITLISTWLELSKLNNQYLDDKNRAINKSFKNPTSSTLDYIWDGDETNPNAALTVFRHFDSSTVIKGFIGQNPKTAWIIDYPLLERIHYLLVAEFDVYGNIGHQLITRLHMDFLRMEGEFNFLSLLPQDERLKLADYWYRDTNNSVKQHLISYDDQKLYDAKIPYRSEQPKLELYNMLKEKLSPVLESKYDIYNKALPFEHTALLSRINRIKGLTANLFPELSLITLVDNLGKKYVYTLIRNTGHSNISSLLLEDSQLLPEEDYLTLVPGIIGNYPSTLFRVNEFRLQQFVEDMTNLDDEDDYERLLDQFAIRRTDRNFWFNSDELHYWFKKNQPLQAGLLDYNRLENR